MDLDNSAIYDLSLKRWKSETCEYAGDSYYNQFYFKISEPKTPTHPQNVRKSLGLHDYSNPNKDEYYYLCGGSFVHKINFHRQEWKLISKGSDHTDF